MNNFFRFNYLILSVYISMLSQKVLCESQESDKISPQVVEVLILEPDPRNYHRDVVKRYSGFNQLRKLYRFYQILEKIKKAKEKPKGRVVGFE